MNTKFKGIIYLHKDSIDYATSQKPETLNIKFSSEMVQDMEIINEEKIQEAINNLFEKEKISPAHNLVILGDSLIFSKTLTEKTPDKQELEIKEYLKNVPFEKISSKNIKGPKESRLLAANKDFFNKICSFFIAKQHTISAVTYQSLFTKELSTESTLNSTQAKSLLAWVDSIKPTDNFNEQYEISRSDSEQSLIIETTKKKSTLPVLLPVFAVLIIVMVALYLSQQNQQKTYVAKAENKARILPTFTPTPKLEPTAVIGTQEAKLKDSDYAISIRILNGSGIVGQAEKTKKILIDAGFNNISTGNASTGTQEKTLVVFSQSLTEQVKSIIMAGLKQTYTDINSQETQESQYQVIITVGSQVANPTFAPRP